MRDFLPLSRFSRISKCWHLANRVKKPSVESQTKSSCHIKTPSPNKDQTVTNTGGIPTPMFAVAEASNHLMLIDFTCFPCPASPEPASGPWCRQSVGPQTPLLSVERSCRARNTGHWECGVCVLHQCSAPHLLATSSAARCDHV